MIPLYSRIIRALLDEQLSNVAEIERITGRGASTVYRWMRGETEPHAEDLRVLIRQCADARARRLVMDMLTADLPIEVRWLDDVDEQRQRLERENRNDGNDVVDMILQAMDRVADLAKALRDSIRTEPKLTEQRHAELVRMMNESVRDLTSARLMLDKYVRRRQKARPLDEPD